MYYVGKEKNEHRLVITDKEKRQEIIMQCNLDNNNKCRGETAMRQIINKRYYWQTIVKDIKEFVSCMWLHYLLCEVIIIK